MYGRYALYGPRKRSRAENQYFAGLGDFPDRYNLAPTQMLPIARLVDGATRVTIAKWVLIPSWAKDPKIGQGCINAVSETVTEKKMYAAPYRKRQRCLVPVCGFYEKRPKGTPRQAYYFTSPDDELLTFAGLWDTWKRPDGEMLVSYTIMTVAPNDFVARFHDRMPVVLET
jgi:putative SOS response-associated peptidase YedK